MTNGFSRPELVIAPAVKPVLVAVTVLPVELKKRFGTDSLRTSMFWEPAKLVTLPPLLMALPVPVGQTAVIDRVAPTG